MILSILNLNTDTDVEGLPVLILMYNLLFCISHFGPRIQKHLQN